jgi:hypothetical protein
MAFGFPAYAEDVIDVDLPRDELRRMVKRTLESLRWRYDPGAKNSLVAKVGVNFWSWGERVRIKLGPDGEVFVRSQCALVTQCIDWGKNQRNVDQFLDRLEEVIDDEFPQARPADSAR